LTTKFSLLAELFFFFCICAVELISLLSIPKEKVSLKDVVEISDNIVYPVFFLSLCCFGFVGKETETDARENETTARGS
jgi:hypothetical protein